MKHYVYTTTIFVLLAAFLAGGHTSAHAEPGYVPTRVWKGIDLNRVPLRLKENHYSADTQPSFGGCVTPPPSNPADAARAAAAEDLQEKGWALLQYNRAAEAVPYLQAAIAAWPNVPSCYRALAEAQMESGQPNAAIATLRTLYDGWPGRNWSQNISGWGEEGKRLGYRVDTDAVLLMQFSLLLQQAGQQDEALVVYHRALRCMPNNRGPLPPVMNAFTATPARLEAATRTCLAMTGGTDDSPVLEAQKALTLQPDLAAAWYQKGRALQSQTGYELDAVVAYTQAVQFGGPTVKSAVKENLGTMPPTVADALKSSEEK